MQGKRRGRRSAVGSGLLTGLSTAAVSGSAAVAGAILSTYVASVTMLPIRAAFQYCFYVSVAAFILVGLVSTFAQEVIGKDSSAEAH